MIDQAIMRYFSILLLILALPVTGLASDATCDKLNTLAQNSGRLGSTYEGKVAGKGRVYFHTAPDQKCVIKDTFVIPGDFIAVYAEHDGWLYVMFINKNGDDFMGWVRENRINIQGSYGKN